MIRPFLVICVLLVTTSLSAHDADINISDAVGAPDQIVEIIVSFDTKSELAGWTFGICHDDAVAEAVDSAVGEAIDEDDFLTIFHQADEDGVRMLAVADPQIEAVLGVSEDLEILVIDYELVGESGDEAFLTFCDTIGTPPMETILAVGDEEAEIAMGIGQITINDNEFVRGDVNGSGAVEALPDALYLLGQFLTEAIAPPCDDAADVDDDGEVSLIVDAIFLLEYAYIDGAAPADPGPTNCGVDATFDSTGCDEGACP